MDVRLPISISFSLAKAICCLYVAPKPCCAARSPSNSLSRPFRKIPLAFSFMWTGFLMHGSSPSSTKKHPSTSTSAIISINVSYLINPPSITSLNGFCSTIKLCVELQITHFPTIFPKFAFPFLDWYFGT